jgi:hypothetical protein
MDGVGRGFGALFGPTKSLRAGENLFAWDSAAKLAFVRSLSARPCVVDASLTQSESSTDKAGLLGEFGEAGRFCGRVA